MFINGHAHVFNLRSVLSRHGVDIIRDRVREEVSPEPLADAVASVIGDLFESIENDVELDEGRIVQKVLEELTDAAGFDDLREKLPDMAKELLDRGLESLEDALLFRLVDGLDRILNQRAGDAKSAGFTDAVALLRLGLQVTTRDVAARLFHQLGPERGAVALMMDITNGDGSDTDLFEAQIQELSDLVLEYPGRFFPFVAVHTARPEHLTQMTKALEERGFVGIKLYPALGYEVGTDAMKKVLREAVRLDAPLLSHTTPSGFFESEEAIDFGDPVHWGPLLEEIDDFRICFAHFGGSSNLTKDPIPGTDEDDPRRRWTGRILELMDADDGERVFTDVAYHTAPMEEDAATEKRYFDNLKSLLSEPKRRDRILFGTDTWVVRLRLSESSYWRFFQDGVDTHGLTKPEFRRLAETNVHRFLGLPLSGPNLPMRPNIERYVEFVRERLDQLRAKPAPWLLEALGEDVAQELETRDWPLADRLNVPGWRELLGSVLQDVLDTTVSGLTGNPVQIVDASFDLDAAPLGFQGDGKMSLQVFNRIDQFGSPEGADEDGVLGPPVEPSAADEDPFEPLRRPILEFDPQKAWVKYRAEGRLALGAQTSFGLKGVGLEATAQKTVVLADYRRHERDERLRDVVPEDLGWPRFALDRENVLRLEPGDAVSFRAHGSLGARVTVAWSDVLTFGLGRLARALDSPAPLGVEITPTASITATVSYEDDFRVVFARIGTGRRSWRVDVRKAETRGRSLTAQIAAGIRFENPDLVASLLTQRLGEPLNHVEALLRNDSIDDLGPVQRKRFEQVAERLGIGTLDELADRVAELKEKAAKTLDEIVRTRLEVGFDYEYGRLETDTALLSAEMDVQAVEALHGHLVRGHFAAVLEWADEPNPGDPKSVDVLRYVLTDTTVTRKAWGFSLNFGRWLQIADRNEKELVVVHQRARLDSGETAERLTYAGSRRYTGRWMDREWGWDVDLDARMDRVSPHAEPMLSDFTYGLGFRFRWQDDDLSENLLDHILDASALWGVFPAEAGGISALRHRFETVLEHAGSVSRADLPGRHVALELQLLFDQVALAQILPRARQDDLEGRKRLAKSLAAAMPFNRDSELHRNLSERRRVYQGLFDLYLRDEDGSGSFLDLGKYRLAARDEVKVLGYPNVASKEAETSASERMWTFTGMLNKNRRTAEQWRSCLRGLGMLADGVGRITGAEHSMFKGLFKDLARFWGQTHHVRALGAYLLDVARIHGMPEGVRPSLRLRFRDDDQAPDVVLGPPKS